MSHFVNYDVTSSNYDSVRTAVGDDVIAAMVQFYCGKPLKDIHILDAGCGTGNYSKSMLQFGAGNVTVMDASSGMLDKAKTKLSDAITSGKVKQLVQATLPTIPFETAAFDAVMFNMVLHHLQNNPDGVNYPKIEEALTEAQRVLKPRGVVAISTLDQYGDYFEKVWYTRLNTDVTERYRKLYPSVSALKQMLNNTGFRFLTAVDVHIPSACDLVMDMEGPSRKEYRDGDSFWACATQEEIDDIEKKVIEMKSDGTLDKFFNEANKLKDHFTYTSVFGVKDV